MTRDAHRPQVAREHDGRIDATPKRHTATRGKTAPDRAAALLQTLRRQARSIEGKGYYQRSDAPDLFELAEAADGAPRGRRSFVFRGVRFEMKFGFRRYVIDPETGETLVGGGFLA